MAGSKLQAHAAKPDPTAGIDTTHFWQRIDSAADWQGRMLPPYSQGVPVVLTGGAVLELPIRVLPNQAGCAVASLIADQALLGVRSIWQQPRVNWRRRWVTAAGCRLAIRASFGMTMRCR